MRRLDPGAFKLKTAEMPVAQLVARRLPDALKDGTFRLTMLRQPVERTVSHYFQCRKLSSNCRNEAKSDAAAADLKHRFLS